MCLYICINYSFTDWLCRLKHNLSKLSLNNKIEDIVDLWLVLSRQRRADTCVQTLGLAAQKKKFSVNNSLIILSIISSSMEIIKYSKVTAPLLISTGTSLKITLFKWIITANSLILHACNPQRNTLFQLPVTAHHA